MNEDAREVPTNNAYLLQQRTPLEGQHCDLAQDLAGRPPPHWEAAAGREGPELRRPRAGAWVSPGSPLVSEFWNSSQASNRLTLRTQSSLCSATCLLQPSAHLVER